MADLEKRYYKKVLMPIEISAGDYCFGGEDNLICEHFSNEGGHPDCDFWLGPLKYDEHGWVIKPKECREFKEI